jgi:hypothetical protein
VAIILDVFFPDFKRSSDVAWVILVIADVSQRLYGWREGKFTEAEKTALLEELKVAGAQQSAANQLVGKLRLDQSERFRIFDTLRFAGALDPHPKATAEIWYQPQDGEAEDFAKSIERALVLANWTIGVPPKPIPFNLSLSQAGAKARGLTILTSAEATEDSHAAFLALHKAFADQAHPPMFTWGIKKEVPLGIIRIVVAPNP